jgi:hypothetical protein
MFLLGDERPGVFVVRRRRVFAGQAVARADERDGPGNDGAEQRQKDDSLIHCALYPSRIADALQHKRSAVMLR